MKREQFTELADLEQATLDRLLHVQVSKGIGKDFSGRWYSREVQAIQDRLRLYRMLARPTVAEDEH